MCGKISKLMVEYPSYGQPKYEFLQYFLGLSDDLDMGLM